MIRVKLAEERPQDRCLPRPHLSTQENESSAIVNAVQKMGKSLFVVLAQEDKPGVRSKVKRLFPKPMKIEVHDKIPSKSYDPVHSIART